MFYPGRPSLSMFPRLSTYDSHVSVQCGRVWQICDWLFGVPLCHLLCWQNWAAPSAPDWAGKTWNSSAGVKKEDDIKPCGLARTGIRKSRSWSLTRVWQSGWYTKHTHGRYQEQPAECSTFKLGTPPRRAPALWQEACRTSPAEGANFTTYHSKLRPKRAI